jgi:hypothetical protein
MSLHVVYTEGAYSVLGEWQRGRWVQFDVHLNLEKVRDGVYVSDDSDGPYTSEAEAYARARELDAALATRTAGVPVLDPNKVQICRVNPVAYDNGQPCACPVGTCNLWRGGLRPAMDELLRKVNGSPRYDATNQLDAAAGVGEARSAEQLEDGFPRWDDQGRRITGGVRASDGEGCCTDTPPPSREKGEGEK